MTPDQRAFEILYAWLGHTYGSRDTYRVMIQDPKAKVMRELQAAISAGLAADRAEIAALGRPS